MTTRIVPVTDASLETREKVFEALVTRGVKTVVKQIVAALREAPLTAAAPEPTAPPVEMTALQTLALATWASYVEVELYPASVENFTAAAELTVDAIADATGELFEPITNELAFEYMETARNRMVNIGETIWEGIRQQLMEGFAAGESIPQIAARLLKFPSVNHYRSVVVARTEVIGAANAGSYFQVLATGIEAQKEWIATEDPRTRISHRHADTQVVDLTGEFAVGIYKDDVKIGEEGMEFPGDPSASAGNVIQCRCTLGYVFSEDEDDVLTADGFVEAEHPRDSDGKFTKKAVVLLPDFDKLTDNQMSSFIKGLTQKSWDSYSTAQQDAIIKRSGTIPGDKGDQANEKLFKLFVQTKKDKVAALAAPKPAAPAAKAPALGGVDKKTGKPTVPGKPVALKVKAVFETNYEDGAIVAVKKDSGERIVWNAQTKKMERQKLGPNGWETTESLTRGALMKKYQNEDGWTTPTAADLAPQTGAELVDALIQAAGPKPFPQLSKMSADEIADFVASLTQDDWNGFTKKQRDELTVKITNSTSDKSIAGAKKIFNDLKPNQDKAPAPVAAPAPAAPATGKPLMLRVKVLFNTKYEPGDVVAVRPGSDERLIWDGKKMQRQSLDFNDNWGTTETLTRGAVYKKYKDEDGWFEPGAPAPAPAPAEAPPVVTSEPDVPETAFPGVETAPEPVATPDAPAPAPVKVFPAVLSDWSDDEVADYIDSLSQEDWNNLEPKQREKLILRSTNMTSDAGIAASNKIFNELIPNYTQPALAPVAAPTPAPIGVTPGGQPFKFTADVLIGKTSKTYVDNQVIAEMMLDNGVKGRLVWKAGLKKYQSQVSTDGVTWMPMATLTKQTAYKNFKGASGWVTPAQGQAITPGVTPGDAPTPAVVGTPTPVDVTVPKPTKKAGSKLTVAELQAQADKVNLTDVDTAVIYKKFRHPFPGGGTTMLSSGGAKIFQALTEAQAEWNTKRPDKPITLLETLRAVDRQAAKDAGANVENKKLYEKAVVEWLTNTANAPATAAKYLATASMTPAEKAAAAKAETDERLKLLHAINAKMSKPSVHVPGTVYNTKTPKSAQLMQDKMAAQYGKWTSTQIAVIKHYSSSGYHLMNDSLRFPAKFPMTTGTLKRIVDLQSSMKPIPEDLLLFRGTGPIEDMLPGNIDAYKNLIGNVVTDEGFFSTSVNKPFTNKLVLEIEAPKGTPGAFIEAETSVHGENELLLAAGTKFQILSAEEIGNGWSSKIKVRLRVVP